MNEILSKLLFYLEYPFVRYALIVGILIALCSSLLGVTLVLKRFSYIGDGLSHVAFGAMAVAMVVSLSNEMLLILPVTVVAAVLLLKNGQNSKVSGDASIAMISVGSLAVGYLILNLFSKSANLEEISSQILSSALVSYLSGEKQRINPMAHHGQAAAIVGVSEGSLKEALGGSYKPLIDVIASGRIKGIAAVVGCSNLRADGHDVFTVNLAKALIQRDILVVSAGCTCGSLHMWQSAKLRIDEHGSCKSGRRRP